MRSFSSMHFFVTKVRMCLHVNREFPGALDQFWPDALSDATSVY